MKAKDTAQKVARWRESMRLRLLSGPIDRSRCGLPRNKIEDVWKYIEKRGPDECWEWTGAKQAGYGSFRLEGAYYKAHRVVYRLMREEIELRAPASNYEQGFILHHCDNRACCNPNHLYRGDIWDNMKDKIDRGRWRGGRKKL